jgi:hypothetical protein
MMSTLSFLQLRAAKGSKEGLQSQVTCLLNKTKNKDYRQF